MARPSSFGGRIWWMASSTESTGRAPNGLPASGPAGYAPAAPYWTREVDGTGACCGGGGPVGYVASPGLGRIRGEG
jgi:hypothetical protein